MPETPTTPAAPAPSLPPVSGLPSHEFGLALGYIVGHHFFDLKDLHYGYFPPDLPVSLRHLAEAQARYTELIIANIPAGVKTILDVGCGAGNNARKLLDHGYQVDCVSPNGFLTSVARQVLAGRATLFETKFQDLDTDRRYDLVLFSESLLFIRPLEVAFQKALTLLNPGGHLLITDIYRIPAEGKSPIGGGHQLAVFRAAIARFPLTLVADVDMTDGIAPTFDLLDRAYREAIQPSYHLILGRLSDQYPWVMKFVKWKFRKAMARYEGKHFSGRRNGANFKKFKEYRLLVFRRTD